MVNVNWPAIKKVLGIPLEEPEDGHFNIAAVSRNDVQEMLISKMGMDPQKAWEIAGALTTEAMTTIALRLSNDYFNLSFWSSLQSIFSDLLSVQEEEHDND